jgi:hypothetical protein
MLKNVIYEPELKKPSLHSLADSCWPKTIWLRGHTFCMYGCVCMYVGMNLYAYKSIESRFWMVYMYAMVYVCIPVCMYVYAYKSVESAGAF